MNGIGRDAVQVAGETLPLIDWNEKHTRKEYKKKTHQPITRPSHTATHTIVNPQSTSQFSSPLIIDDTQTWICISVGKLKSE